MSTNEFKKASKECYKLADADGDGDLTIDEFIRFIQLHTAGWELGLLESSTSKTEN